MDFLIYGLSGGGELALVRDRDTQMHYQVGVVQLSADRDYERVSPDRKKVLLSKHDVKKLITKE